MALLALFGLPFASSLLALTPRDAAKLPACCRIKGRHHCAMDAAQRSSPQHDPAFSSPVEKCPFCPAALTATHAPGPLALPSAQTLAFGLAVHPHGVAQTESRYRIARDRSRQKRGPPALSLL